MLPIEKGCMAVVINSKNGNDGKFVIVGNYVGSHKELWACNNWWEINVKLPFLFGGNYALAPEHNLMRIDGHEQEKIEQKEAELIK